MSIRTFFANACDIDRTFMEHAACRGEDPDLFFPDRGEATAPAKAICARCAVQSECLAYAIEAGETQGIWGGTSGRERRRMRRRVRPAA